MATAFGKAAAAGLTSVAASQEQSTANSSAYPHFLKCLRLWQAMLAKRSSDEIDGELVARGYWRMLGEKLTEKQMSDLTEMVLDRCKWFPTVAECREIMAEATYTNPFYRERRTAELERHGYTSAIADLRPKQITDESDHPTEPTP
jgi:hypothetical protein